MEEVSFYLQLTPAESIIVRKLITSARSNATIQTIIKYLKNINDVTKLIKLAELSPRIEAWCLNPEFEEYWNQVWAYYGRYPTWPEAEKSFVSEYRQLKTQPGIKSFDLVRGMHFFNLANNLALSGRALDDKYVHYFLQKAVKYHNFEGLKLFCRYKLFQYQQHSIALNHVDDTTTHALFERIIYHGTPALLLMANIQYRLGCLYTPTEADTNQYSQHHFFKALTYVYAERDLAPRYENAIYNAYYGLGFSQSSDYDLDSYEAWVDFIEEEIDSLRLSDYQDLAAEQAISIVERVLPTDKYDTTNQVQNTDGKKNTIGLRF